jgi:MFS family permease
MWTWAPVFILASFTNWFDQGETSRIELWADLTSFAVISIGGLGCIWGGLMADRIGRKKLVNTAMVMSGLCCVTIGFFFGQSPWLLIPLLLVWGFFVVADSAQFSAMVTEVAPQNAVGTALTLQTSLGFLLTMLTIQGVPVFTEVVGWRWSFAFLSLGPLVGIQCIRKLRPI